MANDLENQIELKQRNLELHQFLNYLQPATIILVNHYFFKICFIFFQISVIILVTDSFSQVLVRSID